jgi:hypothetical protein
MPRGVYPHGSPLQRESARRMMLKLHKNKEVRAKAAASLRILGKSPEWRERVSIATKARMRDPEVRIRHLAGLALVREKYGPNYRGGNGQDLTPIQRRWWRKLEPLGWLREHPVKTKGHETAHRVPTVYKLDFALLEKKVGLELDGKCHRGRAQQEKDRKKDEVLQSLGWTVLRLKH